MATQAETIQSEMNNSSVFAWSNYGETPGIKIKNLEDTSGVEPDENIELQNKNGEPSWAFNNVKLVGDQFVEATITMPTSTKRDNIMDDIDAGVLASAYDITYSVTDQPDEYTVFKTILRMKILI